MSQRLSVRILSFSLFCLLLSAPLRMNAQSSDGWIAITPPFGYVNIAYADENLLLWAGYDHIYRSLDNGATWVASGAIPEARSIVASAGSFFAVSSKGIYRSDDSGQSWRAVNNGLQMSVPDGPVTVLSIRSLAARANVLYALATATDAVTTATGSIFVSTDQGNTWVERQTGVSVRGSDYRKTTELVAGEEHTFLRDAQGRIYILSHNGQTLTELASVNFADTVVSARSLAVVGRTLVALGANSGDNPAGIYRSDDEGRTWTNASAGIFRSQFPMCRGLLIQKLIAYRDTLIASGSTDCIWQPEFYVYLSFDKAASWTRIAAPQGFTSRHAEFYVGAANNTSIFAIGCGYGCRQLIRHSYTAAPAAPYFASVSAASYRQDDVAHASIMAGFGANLTDRTEAATTLPLPTSLAGVRVVVKDVAGKEREAPLFFVSPTQINYQIPEGLSPGFGDTEVIVKNAGNIVALGRTIIHRLGPSLFTADASGKGVPAAILLRISADGTQTFEPVAQFDPTLNKFVPVPIDLAAESERVYLLLFGTGIRDHRSLQSVNLYTPALADGEKRIVVEYADPAPGFVGLDQVNALLPRSLAGKGEIELQLRIVPSAGYYSNTVRISIK